jgi:lipase maturation factor 1
MLAGQMDARFQEHDGRGHYAVANWLFLRILGVAYLFAFASLIGQVEGLIGSRGILPAADFMREAAGWADTNGLGLDRYRLFPTVFWLSSSDGFLVGVATAGALLSVLQIAGIASTVVLPMLWLLFLSLSVAGRDFLSFQWDALLLETGVVALAVTPHVWWHRLADRLDPPVVGRLLVWWLLFRLMFASGAVKLLSGDPTWRDLTAMAVHYETQPLPTPLAWFLAQLPLWFQKSSTAMVLATELVVPWCILAGYRARRVAAAALLVLQALIALTGNYAYFNLLTAALCLSLLSDDAFARVAPARARSGAWRRTSPWLAAAIAIISVPPSLTMFLRQMQVPVSPPLVDRVIDWIDPLRSVNTYGLFAVMTTTRPEIVVEGSADGVEWRAYEFRFKPGSLERAPRLVAPLQPRLDWQMWFAALASYPEVPWYHRFCERLLEGSPAVRGLLATDPFDGTPPKYVRATLYRYRFAPSGQNAWWVRERLGDYSPVLSLQQQ